MNDITQISNICANVLHILNTQTLNKLNTQKNQVQRKINDNCNYCVKLCFKSKTAHKKKKKEKAKKKSSTVPIVTGRR